MYKRQIAECAAIAGITQNPSKWNPLSYPENNKIRREIIINEMYDPVSYTHLDVYKRQAFLSASEYIATVLIPISRQARIILTAISPRLAISIFENIL